MSGVCLKRPAVRWFGGKWRLAPWIIEHFPDHRIYTESFGGGASVLLRKPRVYAEVYNDLDDSIVGLFRVLQSPEQAAALHQLLDVTPFSRREFELAEKDFDDPVRRAWRLVVRSFMGFGSNSHAASSGFRANSKRLGTTPAHDWVTYVDHLPRLVERFKGVVVENRPAIEVVAGHDSKQTLHYVDPPYVHSTRAGEGRKHRYQHEMTDDDHVELLTFLKTVKGAVVLSGYRSELYDDHLTDWSLFEVAARADGALPRVEALWLNRAAVEGNRGPLL